MSEKREEFRDLLAAIQKAYDEAMAEAAEEGRRLASRREDLIAAGVNPHDLLVPLSPDPCPTCSWPSRETVDLVCQTCGWDYTKGEKPA